MQRTVGAARALLEVLRGYIGIVLCFQSYEVNYAVPLRQSSSMTAGHVWADKGARKRFLSLRACGLVKLSRW